MKLFGKSSSKTPKPAKGRTLAEYPVFSVLSTSFADMGKDGIYPLIRPYCYATIKDGEYVITEPELTDDDKKLFAKLKRAVMQILDVSPSSVKNEDALIKLLEQKFQEALGFFNIPIEKDKYLKMIYYVYRDFAGMNEVEPLLRDPFIEDISCDGVGTNLYIIHRKFGHMRTSIVFNDEETLRDLVVKLAEKCGRYISHADPLMDGTLPDGTRVQATLSKDVTTHGPSFSIRKFPEKPYTPIDILNFKTSDEKVLAYLWQLVENGANMLIIGPTASGKTSLLNSIVFFVPPTAKIVSVEDTREINLAHENWIPAVARTSFSGTDVGEVTMFELLKEAFRQNPDYLIVGEVRGEEANVMFQAMASGMASISTMHAGSADDVMKRLQLPPISLPTSIVETLDVIVMMSKAADLTSSSRRIRSITEVGKGLVLTEVCSWNPVNDSFAFKTDSSVLRRIATERGISEHVMSESIKKKEAILRELKGKNIEWKEVAEELMNYYKVSKKVEAPKTETVEVKNEAPKLEHKQKTQVQTKQEVNARSVEREGTQAKQPKMETEKNAEVHERAKGASGSTTEREVTQEIPANPVEGESDESS